MKSLFLLLSFSWAIAATATAAGQGTSAGSNAGALPDRSVIRIGIVNAQSGPAAALGRSMLAGARAVFDEANRQGGVHGRKLRLLVADDGYEPEQTVEETLRLIHDENVLALFGYVGTPTTNAVLPLLAEMGVPLVGVVSGAQSLRQPVLPHVFNVRASYEEEAEALVAQLVAEGAQRIAVVYQNDGFGLSVLSGAQRALQKRGMPLAGRSSFQRNTLALRVSLDAMQAQQPDAVVVVGPYRPVAAFIEQARAGGLDARFAAVSFVGTEDLVKHLGAGAHNVLVSQVVPAPLTSALPAAVQCRALMAALGTQQMNYVAFEGCLSAQLLLAGLRAAGPAVDRGGLVRSLSGIAQLDLGGIVLRFAADNHQGSQKVYLTRLNHGRIEPIGPD